LSLGWSLLGNHVRAPSGSLSTYEPPAVLNQPTGRPVWLLSRLPVKW